MMFEKKGRSKIQKRKRNKREEKECLLSAMTLMEKAESMRLQACLPQSWWEFLVEHAVHVYNRTPLSRHNWRTPYELLYGERPSIAHLRVFGCGAYVFLPAEVRANKLTPKSEMMTYLGNAPGANGFVFMRSPNNILFYSMHAVFDEAMFLKCPTMVRRPNTAIYDKAPKNPHHHPREGILERVPADVDEEAEPPVRTNTRREPLRILPPPVLEEVPPVPPRQPTPVPRTPSPEQRASPPPPPSAPKRPQRTRRVPKKPDNVYGDRHPVDILRDPTGKKGQKKA